MSREPNVYNYFRTYDPSTGRYLESDPIGSAAGLNTYSCVGNMPTMHTDRLGLANDMGGSYGLRPDQVIMYQEHRRNRQRTETYSFHMEYGGCSGGWCYEGQLPYQGDGTEVLNAPEIIGGGFSLCFEATPTPESCPAGREESYPNWLNDNIAETSFGMGRRLGVTVNSNKLGIDIGLGIGSPISPAYSYGDRP